MVVVDASALIDLLLARPAAEALTDLVFGAGEVIAAPHLIDPEVLQTRYAAFSDPVRSMPGKRMLPSVFFRTS